MVPVLIVFPCSKLKPFSEMRGTHCIILLHVIVVIRKNCYLSQLVVVNAHTTLRAVVHGQRCCFNCSKDLSQYQLIRTLQVTAEGKEPLALPLQLEQLVHTFVPMRSPTPRRGCSLCFLLLRSVSPANTQRGGTARAPFLLVLVCRDRLTMLAVVLC